MTTLGPLGYKKGWNTKIGPYGLGQDQMSDAQNVYIVGDQIFKRNGSVAVNADAFGGGAAVTGLFDWQTAAGQRYMIVTAGTKIGQAADLGGTISDITGAVTITTGANNQSSFASLNNILVRCGGATPDAPIKWTGTGNAAALGGTPPSGRLVTVVNNFMFISGVAATPSRIFWSNVGDPETWGATNYADFRISDGDQVTAIAPLGQNLCVFKRRSIGLLYTTPPSSAASVGLGPLITVVNGFGCVGGQAWASLPDGSLVFLSTEGHLLRFDGTTLTDLSDRDDGTSSIQPTLDTLQILRLPYAVVRTYPYRSQIWLSASKSGSSTNNSIYVYNKGMEVWESAYDNINANIMANFIDTRSSPSHPNVLLTGNYSGTIYEQDKGRVNPEETNTNIDAFATLSIQLGADKQDFIPRSVLIPFEYVVDSTIEVDYGFDGLIDTDHALTFNNIQQGARLDMFILDTDMLAAASTLTRKTLPINYYGSSSSIQIKVRNQFGNQSIKMNPIFVSDEILV